MTDPRRPSTRAQSDATRVRPVGRGVSKLDFLSLDLPQRTIGAASPVKGIPLPRGHAQELNDDRALERMLKAAHEWGPTGQLEQAGRAGYDLGMAVQDRDVLRGVGALAAGGGAMLPEGRGLTNKAVREFADALQKRLGLQALDVGLSGTELRLANMVVPPEMRGQGIGTQAMQELTRFADDNGLRATLTPAARGYNGASSTARLRDFYKRFGFVDNKGRAKDFAISDAMYREPRRK